MSISLLKKCLVNSDEPTLELPAKRKRKTYNEIYHDLLAQEADRQVLRPEKIIKPKVQVKKPKIKREFKSKIDRIIENDKTVDPKLLYQQNIEKMSKRKHKISQEIVERLTQPKKIKLNN